MFDWFSMKANQNVLYFCSFKSSWFTANIVREQNPAKLAQGEQNLLINHLLCIHSEHCSQTKSGKTSTSQTNPSLSSQQRILLCWVMMLKDGEQWRRCSALKTSLRVDFEGLVWSF
jgi:hypothetical protein